MNCDEDGSADVLIADTKRRGFHAVDRGRTAGTIDDLGGGSR